MTGPRGPTEGLDAAAVDAASQEYLRVFATHREALVAAIRVYLAAALQEPTEAAIDAAETWYFGDAHPPERKVMRPFIRGMARAILNASKELACARCGYVGPQRIENEGECAKCGFVAEASTAPDWDALDAYLREEISLERLSECLGCNIAQLQGFARCAAIARTVAPS